MEFPEVKTKEKRREKTGWRCTITMTSGEVVHLQDREAEAFFNAIKNKVHTLKYDDFVGSEVEDDA